MICVFIPLLIISIILLDFGTIDTFDINNFFPIMGYNYETTFIKGLQNIFILNFLWVFFFILPNLKRKNDLKSIIFSSLMINIVLIILSVIAILSFFPALSTKSISVSSNLSSIYLITRRIQINSFLKQTDIIFLFIWAFSIFGYIGFLTYSISHVLNKLFAFENKSRTVFPIASIILGFCLITNKINIIRFLENNVFKYFSIILIRNLFDYFGFI